MYFLALYISLHFVFAAALGHNALWDVCYSTYYPIILSSCCWETWFSKYMQLFSVLITLFSVLFYSALFSWMDFSTWPVTQDPWVIPASWNQPADFRALHSLFLNVVNWYFVITTAFSFDPCFLLPFCKCGSDHGPLPPQLSSRLLQGISNQVWPLHDRGLIITPAIMFVLAAKERV